MWAQAVGAALTFFSGSKKEKKQDKKDKENLALEAMYNREQSQFDAETQYYYQQLNKQEKMRGLDEFRKFSTVSNFAPNYQNTNPGPVVPAKPAYNSGSYSNTTGKTQKVV